MLLINTWELLRLDYLFEWACEIATCSSGDSNISISKVKIVPNPKPYESTLIEPLFAATSCEEICKPRPIPSGFRSADWLSFPNCLNRFFLSCSVIPTPVSLTLTNNLEFSLLYYAVRTTLPFFVNFSAFFVKLISICFNLTSSPTNKGNLDVFCSA